MDQIKIGKFISSKRKEKGLTQSDLSERLNISDRAISKWENGNCLPDVSNIQELCKILGITINDLFSGEIVDMKNNEKKLEENLLEMTRIKEETDKKLLRLEWVIGYTSSIAFLTLIFVASYIEMETWLKLLLIAIGLIIFAVGVCNCLKIEQTAGYYECGKCHHKYIPTYQRVFWAMHLGRTRYMKCPECGKRSWNKKVLRK